MGCPKGAFLVPFFLYDSLSTHNFVSKISIYAENTMSYYKGTNLSNTIGIIQADLDKYAQWCIFK